VSSPRIAALVVTLAVVATTAPGLAAPAATAPAGPPLAVRWALVAGNRGEAPLPDIGQVLSDRLMADYLTQWDPHSDNPEILRLFALEGLSEVTRQAARLAPGAGGVAGSARVGEALWRVDLELAPPRDGTVVVRAAIARDGELVAAPSVGTSLGEKAIVSTRHDDGTFVFLVVQVDDWAAVQAARRPGEGSGKAAVAVAGEPGIAIPRVVVKVPPRYPESEKASGRQGAVVLALRVDERGEVAGVRVAQGLGPAFDEAAVAAVRQWRFEPGRRDGEPVAVEMSITVNFRP
jgi:TonB family protein